MHFPANTILVITTRQLGDVLLTTPLVRSLRQAYPKAQIDFMVFRGTDGILRGNTDIDNIIQVPERPSRSEHWQLFRDIFRRYDLAISTMIGDRPMLYALLAGRKRISAASAVGTKGHWKRLLMHRWVTFDDDNTHTVEQNLKLADALNIPRCHSMMPPADDKSGESINQRLPFDRQNTPYAVVHMMPMWRYKRWTVPGWTETVKYLRQQKKLQVVLTGGPAAEERADIRDAALNMPDDVVNLAGALNFGEVAQLIKHAKLYIGPDTAITHLASSVGVPIVALFGPTNPVKWGPWPSGYNDSKPPFQRVGTQRIGNVLLLQGAGDCVPCHREGCEGHTLSHSDCLDTLSVDRMIQAIDEMLI